MSSKLLAPLAVLAALTLAACGGDAPVTDAPPADTAAPETTPAPADATPPVEPAAPPPA